MKVNDSPFLKHCAPEPRGIHCSHDAFGFSHPGMRLLSKSIHSNTFWPFRERTPFWIILCHLRNNIACVLTREAGISPSVVKHLWVFLLWCKLASIFPSSSLILSGPLFIYKALEAHTGSWPYKKRPLVNVAPQVLAQRHTFLWNQNWYQVDWLIAQVHRGCVCFLLDCLLRGQNPGRMECFLCGGSW